MKCQEVREVTRSMALQDKGAASSLLSLQCHGDIHRAEWLGGAAEKSHGLSGMQPDDV